MKFAFVVFLFLFSACSISGQIEQVNNIKLIDFESKNEGELRNLEEELESYYNYQKSIIKSGNDKEKSDASDLAQEIEKLLAEVRNHIEKDHANVRLDKLLKKIEEIREIDESLLDKESMDKLWNKSFSLAMDCQGIDTENLSKDVIEYKSTLCSDATALANEIKNYKDSTPWYWRFIFVLVALPVLYFYIAKNRPSTKAGYENSIKEKSTKSGDERRYSIAVHKKCATCLYWSGARSFSEHRTDIIISALDKSKRFHCNHSEVSHGRAKTTCDWSCSHYSRVK